MHGWEIIFKYSQVKWEIILLFLFLYLSQLFGLLLLRFTLLKLAVGLLLLRFTLLKPHFGLLLLKDLRITYF